MLLVGPGIGALASQLGSITVSSVPDEQAGEVGGLQNTLTNLGASLGTALAGAVLISSLTASFLNGIQSNPATPERVKAEAPVKLAAGIPFVSDAQLQAALDEAGVPRDTANAIVDENNTARLDALAQHWPYWPWSASPGGSAEGSQPNKPGSIPSEETHQ